MRVTFYLSIPLVIWVIMVLFFLGASLVDWNRTEWHAPFSKDFTIGNMELMETIFMTIVPSALAFYVGWSNAKDDTTPTRKDEL